MEKSSSVLILGEAPESDGEDENESFTVNNDRTTGSSQKHQTPVADTACVQKLKDRNVALYESLESFKKQIVNSANLELNNINQQLLKSQMELQQTLLNTQVGKNNLIEYQKELCDILSGNYIPDINIKIPKHFYEN